MIFSGWAPKSANEGEIPDAEALWMIRWDSSDTAQGSGGKRRLTE